MRGHNIRLSGANISGTGRLYGLEINGQSLADGGSVEVTEGQEIVLKVDGDHGGDTTSGGAIAAWTSEGKKDDYPFCGKGPGWWKQGKATLYLGNMPSRDVSIDVRLFLKDRLLICLDPDDFDWNAFPDPF